MVNPARSVSRAWFVARAIRSASGSFSTWSFHAASSYGCSSRCECASMRPGRSVVPGSATRRADGCVMVARGPAATMRSPRTRTRPAVVDVGAVEDTVGDEERRRRIRRSEPQSVPPTGPTRGSRSPTGPRPRALEHVFPSVTGFVASSSRLDVETRAPRFGTVRTNGKDRPPNKENDDGAGPRTRSTTSSSEMTCRR